MRRQREEDTKHAAHDNYEQDTEKTKPNGRDGEQVEESTILGIILDCGRVTHGFGAVLKLRSNFGRLEITKKEDIRGTPYLERQAEEETQRCAETIRVRIEYGQEKHAENGTIECVVEEKEEREN